MTTQPPRFRRLGLGLRLLSGLVALAAAPALAAPPAKPSPTALREQFAQANRHYAAGEYEKARDLYSAVAEHALSREVYFNLGNCHFRLGQTGRASLAYRRALLADPGMVEARQNLRFLKSKLGSLSFESSGLHQAVGRLSPRQWLWVASLGGWLLALGVASRLVFRIRQPLGGMVVALAVCGGMIGVTAGWAAGVSFYRLSPANLAIVVEDGAVALTGPFPDAKPVRSLSPGSEVRIEADRGDWLFVYLPGDHAGWIDRRAVEPLWRSQS